MGHAPDSRLTDADALAEELASRIKRDRSDYLIGGEFEFLSIRRDGQPLAYDGEPGIRSLFEVLIDRGWTPQLESDYPIALTRDGASITLEPGGQVELSGKPWKCLNGVSRELDTVRRELDTASREVGIGLYQAGLQPFFANTDIPWVPKGRYALMKSYLPTRGQHAHRMMKETAGSQVNLDFNSEADMARKFRLSSRLGPVATALFANSPITRRRPNGLQSQRAAIWEETDPDRCGLVPSVFRDDFGFADYVQYALDVPMLFLYRGGAWTDMDAIPFRRYMAEGYKGFEATWYDWDLHLSGIFTDVRLKGYLEIRTADGLPWPYTMAVPALWKGLLYCPRCMDNADRMTGDWSHADVIELGRQVAVHGLGAEFRGEPLLALAREFIQYAWEGLTEPERPLLQPMVDYIDKHGASPAVQFAELWASKWQHDLGAFLEDNGVGRGLDDPG